LTQILPDHIERLPVRDASSGVPPSLVFYAARNILSPSFIIGQIPDLLNLLTAIETFRRFAVLKSGEALEWQKYYEHEKSHGRAEDVRLLAANEVRTLRHYLEEKDAQRREYIVLVRSLIQLVSVSDHTDTLLTERTLWLTTIVHPLLVDSTRIMSPTKKTQRFLPGVIPWH
jgi:hypothetical protein